MSDKQIEDFLKYELKEAIDELMRSSGAFVRVLSIDKTTRIDNGSGSFKIFYVLGVETNISQLVFANDNCLKKRVEDRLRVQIQERYGIENVYVYVDVDRPQQVLKQSKPEAYSFVPIEEALKRGFVMRDSPLANFCLQYKIDHILYKGEWLIGPSIELASLIALIIPKWKPAYVLDLFCGTGALSRIALLYGARRVTCVDLYINAAYQTLKDFKKKVRLIEGDVFSFDFDQHYDLVIADPPHILALKVAEELIDKIMHSTDLLVFYHGHSEQLRWNQQIREILSKISCNQVEVDKDGATMTVLSKGKKGNHFVKKALPHFQSSSGDTNVCRSI